jgi:hypothetical protein
MSYDLLEYGVGRVGLLSFLSLCSNNIFHLFFFAFQRTVFGMGYPHDPYRDFRF